jgi:hypothetical protein
MVIALGRVDENHAAIRSSVFHLWPNYEGIVSATDETRIEHGSICTPFSRNHGFLDDSCFESASRSFGKLRYMIGASRLKEAGTASLL